MENPRALLLLTGRKSPLCFGYVRLLSGKSILAGFSNTSVNSAEKIVLSFSYDCEIGRMYSLDLEKYMPSTFKAGSRVSKKQNSVEEPIISRASHEVGCVGRSG